MVGWAWQRLAKMCLLLSNTARVCEESVWQDGGVFLLVWERPVGVVAEVVGKVTEVVGKIAEVVGEITNVVGEIAEVVRKVANVVGKVANMVEKVAEVVGEYLRVGPHRGACL